MDLEEFLVFMLNIKNMQILPVMFAKHYAIDLLSVNFQFLNLIPVNNRISSNTLAVKERKKYLFNKNSF